VDGTVHLISLSLDIIYHNAGRSEIIKANGARGLTDDPCQPGSAACSLSSPTAAYGKYLFVLSALER
jgi:hypothetical protein